ncbi:hypothetical protein ACFLWS_03825 [Chloroflexota bacterium]
MDKKESKKKKRLDINELAAKIVKESTEEKPSKREDKTPKR